MSTKASASILDIESCHQNTQAGKQCYNQPAHKLRTAPRHIHANRATARPSSTGAKRVVANNGMPPNTKQGRNNAEPKSI